MCKIVELAINSGAKTINIPDTVGYTIPSEFTSWWWREGIGRIDLTF